jgi:hypothetical protein
MFVQLLLCTRLAAYFPIVVLNRTSDGKTYLQKTSCAMILVFISNSLRLSVGPSKLGADLSVIPRILHTKASIYIL